MKWRIILICIVLMLLNKSVKAGSKEDSEAFLMLGGVYEGCLVISYENKLLEQNTVSASDAVKMSTRCFHLVESYDGYKTLPADFKEEFLNWSSKANMIKFEQARNNKK